MLNKIFASCMIFAAIFALAFGGCKKSGEEASAINVDAITEDNALEEAEKVLEEIDKL